MQGCDATYKPISIIEFQGWIGASGQSQGHYISDVQEQTSKAWFRTNDNSFPVPIQSDEVSKKPYVILLSRSDD